MSRLMNKISLFVRDTDIVIYHDKVSNEVSIHLPHIPKDVSSKYSLERRYVVEKFRPNVVDDVDLLLGQFVDNLNKYMLNPQHNVQFNIESLGFKNQNLNKTFKFFMESFHGKNDNEALDTIIYLLFALLHEYQAIHLSMYLQSDRVGVPMFERTNVRINTDTYIGHFSSGSYQIDFDTTYQYGKEKLMDYVKIYKLERINPEVGTMDDLLNKFIFK